MSDRLYPTNYPGSECDPSLLAHERAENTGPNLRKASLAPDVHEACLSMGLSEQDARRIAEALSE